METPGESTPLAATGNNSAVINAGNDASHPFYLHPSDSPRMALVNSIFDGRSYGGWRRAVFIALSAKNKLSFIDGSLSEPAPSSPTKVKRIWDELDSLDSCAHCTCDCSCGGKNRTLKSHQDGRLIQFLMGLNEAYASVRSNILMISPLPSVNQAYSLLVQDEKQREIHANQQPIESAFMATRQQLGGQKFNSFDRKGVLELARNTLFCTYCKKPKHTVEKCYRLISFPADFKFTKNKRPQGGVQGNTVFTSNDAGNQSFNSNLTEKNFTQEQYQNMCHMYQQFQQFKLGPHGESNSEVHISANCAGIAENLSSSFSSSSKSIIWILDSGASEHMTHDPTLLFDIHTLLTPIYVNLPNSQRIKVNSGMLCSSSPNSHF